MASIKTAKVQAEIEKARLKLAEQQAKIKELENKQTELENIEIVDIVRGLKIPLEGLAATLEAIRTGSTPTGAPTSGQVGPKSKTVKALNEKNKMDGEDVGE
jgi:hypothetical protein